MQTKINKGQIRLTLNDLLELDRNFNGGPHRIAVINNDELFTIKCNDRYLFTVIHNGVVGINTPYWTHTLTVGGDFTALIKVGTIAEPDRVETGYSFIYTDPFRFRMPYKVQYYNFTTNQWVDWNTTDVKYMFDGRSDTMFLIPSADYRKIAIYFDNIQYVGLKGIVLVTSWNVLKMKVSVEKSTDASFTNPQVVLPETEGASYELYEYFTFNEIGYPYNFVRIVIDITQIFSNSSYPVGIVNLIGVGMRVSPSSRALQTILPLSWDFERNIGIKTDNPAYTLDVNGSFRVGSSSNFVDITSSGIRVHTSEASSNQRTDGVYISGGASNHNPSIELRKTSGYPHIDFSRNTSVDYHARLILFSDNEFHFAGNVAWRVLSGNLQAGYYGRYTAYSYQQINTAQLYPAPTITPSGYGDLCEVYNNTQGTTGLWVYTQKGGWILIATY